MNGIYSTVDLLEKNFRAVGFKRITFGDPAQVDLNKEGMYPMMHITLSTVTLGDNSQVLTFDLVWLDILYNGKPLDPRTVKDEMSNISNNLDIFHDISFRINDAFQGFKNELNLLIQVPDALILNALFAKAQNHLAGYEASFVITIPTECQTLTL